MARRQKQWARAARAKLVQMLGGTCVNCAETDPEKLELDHVTPRDWGVKPSQIGSDSRIAKYRREAAEGKLQVLCKHCNSSKGARELVPMEIPF